MVEVADQVTSLKEDMMLMVDVFEELSNIHGAAIAHQMVNNFIDVSCFIHELYDFSDNDSNQ